MRKFLFIIFIYVLLFYPPLHAEVLKKFEVEGNSRISTETLKVYGEIELNKNYTTDDINEIIKKLYDTKFFSKISTSFANNTLKITVEENPIINTIIIVLMIGFSSTVIVRMLLEKLAEILEKNFVS